MPRFPGKVATRLYLPLALAIALFAFTPISKALLWAVNGSFAPSPYTSLSLRTPSDAATGIRQGEPVQVELTNRSGGTRIYRWRATQAGTLIDIGVEKLANGQAEAISVPTAHAASGSLRVSITGTHIYVAVPILKS